MHLTSILNVEVRCMNRLIEDTYEHVYCRECGRKYKQITTEHLLSHAMRLADYQEKYPDAPVTSQKTLKIRQEKQGGDKHPWIGRSHSEETKKKLREVQLKNSGIRGKHLSEEHKKKISEAITGIKRSSETKKKISESRTGLKISREGRKLLSKSAKLRFKERPESFGKFIEKREGKEHPSFGKPCPHRKTKRSLFTKSNGQVIYLRSTWEQAVCEYLDRLDVEWEYEFKKYDLGEITYCPDFTIFNDDGSVSLIIEVKGWMNDISVKQISLFREKYPELPFEVWDREALLEKGIEVK